MYVDDLGRLLCESRYYRSIAVMLVAVIDINDGAFDDKIGDLRIADTTEERRRAVTRSFGRMNGVSIRFKRCDMQSFYRIPVAVQRTAESILPPRSRQIFIGCVISSDRHPLLGERNVVFKDIPSRKIVLHITEVFLGFYPLRLYPASIHRHIIGDLHDILFNCADVEITVGIDIKQEFCRGNAVLKHRIFGGIPARKALAADVRRIAVVGCRGADGRNILLFRAVRRFKRGSEYLNDLTVSEVE